MLAMMCRCRELGIDDPLLQVRLFDALVQPVMMYAVELWGASGVAKGELAGDLVHRAFLRRLLGVRLRHSQHGGPGGGRPLSAAGVRGSDADEVLESAGRQVDADQLTKRAFVVSAALSGNTAQCSTATSRLM